MPRVLIDKNNQHQTIELLIAGTERLAPIPEELAWTFCQFVSLVKDELKLELLWAYLYIKGAVTDRLFLHQTRAQPINS